MQSYPEMRGLLSLQRAKVAIPIEANNESWLVKVPEVLRNKRCLELQPCEVVYCEVVYAFAYLCNYLEV